MKRRPTQMKSYASFDHWAKAQTPRHQKLIAKLRRLVNQTSPKLTECVKWGNGFWEGKNWPVIYIYADDDHLQFGFTGGVYLTDPSHRLMGKGQYIRHVKVYTAADIDARVFARWIRQAAKLERAG